MKISVRNEDIKTTYLKETKKGKDADSIIDDLLKKYDIGRFYIRSILKDHEIIIKPKTKYKSSNTDRDDEIVKLFNADTDLSIISKQYDLTPTRISQILRGKLGKSFKKLSATPKLTLALEEIKLELIEGIPYTCSCKTACSCKTITNIHGKDLIKRINYALGYNVFQHALEYRIKDIVKMSKDGIPPKDIASKHNVTLNYTYLILHDNGIRSKISKEAKIKRDKKIWESKKKGIKIENIAKEHHITSTMVRIILSEIKTRKKNETEKLGN